MSRFRIALITLLISLPVLFYLVVASIYLWQTGWIFIAAAITIPCFGVGIYLANKTVNKLLLKPIPETTPATHYTVRDEQAWQLVVQQTTDQPTPSQAKLTQARFYFDTAENMAQQISRIYYPDARDALGGVTVPEILAVLEMASHDMCELVEKYIPGSHLLTIDRLRKLQEVGQTATKWWSTLNKAYWIGSALLNPANAAVRYIISRIAIAGPLDQLKEGLGAWFYQEYVRKLGHYFIELYSGRLRVGVKRYRELQKQHAVPSVPESAPVGAEPIAIEHQTIQISLLGQPKTGKSNFIAALTGNSQSSENSPTQVLLKQEDFQVRLHEAESFRNQDFTRYENVIQQSGVILLFLRLDHPLRGTEQAFVQYFQEFFNKHPERKPPALIIVGSYADQLDHQTTWQPPYDWLNPESSTEQKIATSVNQLRAQFPGAVAILPTCLLPGRIWGVNEYFTPLLTSLLPAAQGVALLGFLQADQQREPLTRVGEQLLNVGKSALANVWKKITG